MNPSNSRESLRQQTDLALRRSATHMPPNESTSPRIGDLLITGECGARPDFWLVAECRPYPNTRVRLVPADIDPICGGGDLALADSGTVGDLTIRCLFAFWIDARALPSMAAAGSLSAEALETVGHHLAAIDIGELTETALETDTEAELEYRDLVAELTEARSQLLASSQPQAGVPRQTRQLETVRHFGTTAPFAVAASVLLALAFGLAAGWSWRGEQVEPGMVPTFPDPSSAQSTPLVNLPFEWLGPKSQVRSKKPGESAQVVELAEGVPYVALFLDVGVGPETEFQLNILRDDADEAWWSGTALRTGLAEIFLLLPTAGLAPGDYVLELYTISEPVTLRFVYELRLERPPTL